MGQIKTKKSINDSLGRREYSKKFFGFSTRVNETIDVPANLPRAIGIIKNKNSPNYFPITLIRRNYGKKTICVIPPVPLRPQLRLLIAEMRPINRMHRIRRAKCTNQSCAAGPGAGAVAAANTGHALRGRSNNSGDTVVQTVSNT